MVHDALEKAIESYKCPRGHKKHPNSCSWKHFLPQTEYSRTKIPDFSAAKTEAELMDVMKIIPIQTDKE
ncbi:MAG: hypothetical protein C0399_03290 [Syntrophus sp. (in: bacteria)]|nr:hypothetical protein [Syntrophus sp. (in: bacteria)]